MVPLLQQENGEWIDPIAQKDAFRKSLLRWGKDNFRPFQWRQTHDPYAILIAEIMLHRTQVRQVVPIYEQFMIMFPTLTSLRKASFTEVRKVVASLGLSWRIDLIEHMADEVEKRFDGVVPSEKADLLSLPGVSEYIASAVRCFAWNIPDALIDTNTVRVTGRIFNLLTKDSSRRNPIFRKLIQQLVDPDQPRDFNYALLDLAHLVCYKKTEPDCPHCPIKIYCWYGQSRLNRMGEVS